MNYDTYEARLFEELDRNLNEYVYSTLWDEISGVEQDILAIMAEYGLRRVIDIREKYNELYTDRAQMTSANFSKYRDKLIKMSILRSSANTYLEIMLPRFDNYVRMNYQQ